MFRHDNGTLALWTTTATGDLNTATELGTAPPSTAIQLHLYDLV